MCCTINCKCGYRTEFSAAPTADPDDVRRRGEVLADRHEAQGARRAYRHETAVEVTR